MAVAAKTDYVAGGLDRLLEQFKGKPRIEALLSAWLAEFQEIENNAYTLYVERQLQDDVAADDLLDKLGAIVGQGRQGYSDAIYRRLITARIKANRSDGRRSTLLAIAALLVPDATIVLREYRGSVYIEPIAAMTLPGLLAGREFLGRAVAAGVLLMFVYSSSARSTTLVLGSVDSDVTAPTAAQSLGSIDGSVTTSGVLSSAYQNEDGSA